MANAKQIMPGVLVRALRLPFISASVLPFIFGSLLAKSNFNPLFFSLGLICVICAHLSANLINDYADSKSGADWQDKNFYKFFGGSKLIQEKILPEKFYLDAAIICFILACFCAAALSFLLQSRLIIMLFILIIFLAWAYSERPLALSYHCVGEIVIFLLFGPAVVMGGYFIQTGVFPAFEGFLLSLPFGFLTAAILFSNEVPDFPEDKISGKFTWVSLTAPKRAYAVYILLMVFAFGAIVLNLVLGYLKPFVLLSLIFIIPAIKAAAILKKHFRDKKKLIESSKLTVSIQALVGVILILGVLL